MFVTDADLMAQQQRYEDLLRRREHERILKRIRPSCSCGHKPAKDHRRSLGRRLAAILCGHQLGGRRSMKNQPCSVSCCSARAA